MIVLAGAAVVLPGRVVPIGSLLIHDGRIAAIEERSIDGPAGAVRVDWSGHTIVPGFIDVHVHGVEGVDALDGSSAIDHMARRLPKYGVTAFCPTSVACDPPTLERLLAAVSAARRQPDRGCARVMPAHLESNFINPDWKGAQPQGCLRSPVPEPAREGEFTGRAILDVIAAAGSAAGIVTIAPELPGGIELVRALVKGGHRVSIGHSGASYRVAMAAIEAGVSHATHLFNRMSAMTSRAPGVVGAVLTSEEVAAEIICDGYHVHPALVTLACARKSPRAVMAITDGTAGSGLPVGSRTRLGAQEIIVGPRSAALDDGTLAGSTLTMDGAFRMLMGLGLHLHDVARMCAATPAEALGLPDIGQISTGFQADLVVLDSNNVVKQTYVAGNPALEH